MPTDFRDKTVLTMATVGSESIAKGDFILVKHAATNGTTVGSFSDWKARVLEVRALDEKHVFIRVSWLNRPEDLPGGRQDHHGRNELIPTNQMDVIDAYCVNGTFQLKHGDELESSGQKGVLSDDVYFWRQTFNFVDKTLSVRPEIDGT